jgi:5-methylthioadenosine/S-adenosylhomocysteine deaminase
MAADMFTQMRLTFTLQRALVNERAIKGEQELPMLPTARDCSSSLPCKGRKPTD